MKTVQDILKYPPTKKVTCDCCAGRGIINPRGMVSSDPCPKCEMDGYYGKSGKMIVIDFEKAEKMIRKIIKLAV